MAVEPQVQQFIDFIRDEMPRRIKTNPNNLPDAQKLLVSVSGTLEVIYKTLAELDIAIKSDVDTELSNKEPTITEGSSTQYWRGDKSWQTLNTDAVSESTNKRYLNDAQKVIATQAANGSQAGYLASADWTTFNSKQAALADVITAGAYGSSTQYPVITFNAKGIATGVTLQTVPLPTFTDATFSVQKNGSPSIAASWDLTALTASYVHTYPNKAIDFKTLSSIGASDSNTLSGTRNRILGGSSNTVSGTDIVAIDCSDNVLSGEGVTYLSTYNTGGITSHTQVRGTTVLGSSLHPILVLFGTLSGYGGALAATVGLGTDALSANGVTNSITTNTGAPANSNTPMLVSGYESGATRYASLGSAVHDVEFIVMFGTDSPIVPSRTFFAKRRVYAAYHIVSGTPTWATSTEVVGTDTNLGTVVGTVTVDFTLDTTNNRLVPTVSATGGQSYQASVRVNSHYNRKG